MTKPFLRFIAMGALLASMHLPASSQVTKLTNLPYGPFSVGSDYSKDLFLYGDYFYFIGRSGTNVQEWHRLNLTNNTVTQVTSNHFQDPTTYVVFRDPVRFGDNVFVSSAAPNNLQDLEFSRFNLATATEQRADIATGYYSTSPTVVANSSDPIVYISGANGRVYFKPATPTTGNQVWYWNPVNQTVAPLTSYNLPAGLSQNTAASMAIAGDFLYTSIGSAGSSTIIRVNLNTGAVSPLANAPYYITSLTSMNGKIYFSARATTATGIPFNLYVYNPATSAFTRLTNYPTTTPTTTGSSALRDIFAGNDGKTLFVNTGINISTSANGDFFSVNTLTDQVTNRNIGVSSASAPDRCFYLHSTTDFVYVVRQTSTSRGIYKINLATNVATLISANNFTAIATNTFTTKTNVLDPGNGRLYMVASEQVYGSEVYELNLATDAFTRLTNINPNGDSGPNALEFANSKLYFLASAIGTETPNYEFYSVPVAQVLPLKWIHFAATPAPGGHVQLAWEVAEMQGVKSFAIEVSTDGSNWHTAGNVAATSATKYEYLDKAREGKIIYYRVKEISVDGSHTYSPIQKVLMATKSSSFTLLNNPSANNTITIEFTAVSVKGTISITDANGRLVSQRQWTGGTGKLPLTVPAAGTYNVNFNDQNIRAVVQ